MSTPRAIGRSLATFNLALLIIEKSKVAMVFALELKLSKTLRGLVYFVLQSSGWLRPPYKYGTKYKAPSEFLATSIPKQKP